MIERFDSDPDALGNRLDGMLQGGLRIRMRQASLDVLDSRQLSHVRTTRTPEHLMANAKHACRLGGFLEGREKKIVGVDRGAASRVRYVRSGCRKRGWTSRRRSPCTPRADIFAVLQALLRDRIKLLAHMEIKEQPVLALVVVKGDPKLAESKELPKAIDGESPLKPGEMQSGRQGVAEASR